LAIDDLDGTFEPRAQPGHGQVFLGTAGAAAMGTGAQQLLHVYRLSEQALAEMPLEALLDELLSRTREILDVDTVAILLLDENGEELVARAAKGLEEEVERGVRIPLGGGFAGRIAAERTPIFIADVDHAEVLNPILRDKGIRSLLGVPLIVDGKSVGVLHVGTLTPREFTNDNAALLQVVAQRAAPAIERARLYEALDREHRGAVALQRSLLPESVPDIVGVDIAARYMPARDEVGGDWYDVIDLPGGQVGLAIGDVAGHGVRAAALMGQLRTGLRAYALDGYAPGETLKHVDRLLHTVRGEGMATAAYAILDPATGALRLASAGHPPAVVVPSSGRAYLLESKPAPPLGTLPFGTYRETEATLAPGDALMLYTDGLVERRREPLTVGLERLRVHASVVASADALAQRVVNRLVPPDGADDDVAIVVVRNLPIPAQMRLRFPATPQVLSQIRQVLRRWLHAHGAAAEDIAALTLACGEACANAIEHAYSPAPTSSFEVDTEYVDGLVTLAVRDSGRWRPSRTKDRGRGLFMIEATVDQLDVRSTGAGTEVVMRRRLASA
jgi:anti-sigma regulatory factor (Ser/Thr protein kinase)/putative methionine-R-sulfoxide reductase with GAF domain